MWIVKRLFLAGLLGLAAFGFGVAVAYAQTLLPLLTASDLPLAPAPAPITADTSRVVQVWWPEGLGHACPVGPDRAFTANHVLTESPQMFGDMLGNSGTIAKDWMDTRRDLAHVVVQQGRFNGWYRIASALPQPGDAVLIVGFGEGLKETVVRARVILVAAGHFTYDDTPGPGSSGSCVLLERTGEAVGINYATAGGGTGMGVLLSGGWDDVPVEYR